MDIKKFVEKILAEQFGFVEQFSDKQRDQEPEGGRDGSKHNHNGMRMTKRYADGRQMAPWNRRPMRKRK